MSAGQSKLIGRYRMPAEWEPQEQIWFSWPTAAHLWPGRMQAVQDELWRIIICLLPETLVGLNGFNPDEPNASKRIATLNSKLRERLIISRIPTDDAWCRDHGPTWVEDSGHKRRVGIDWGFNAWGEKHRPWQDDHFAARRMLDFLELDRMECPFVGEGGGIEVNGSGALLLTESVWMNPNRNAGVGKPQISSWLAEHLGCDHFLWFTDGLADDDTDGHIDMFARFVNPTSIVLCSEKKASHPQYHALQQIREQAEGFRTPTGGRYDFIPLPMPDPIVCDGELCPATYGNFLICNRFVVVPQYEQEKPDRQALGILKECFPRHEIIPMNNADTITEGGAIHCLSQQLPLATGSQ
jgi:agmatine deiminase